MPLIALPVRSIPKAAPAGVNSVGVAFVQNVQGDVVFAYAQSSVHLLWRVS